MSSRSGTRSAMRVMLVAALFSVVLIGIAVAYYFSRPQDLRVDSSNRIGISALRSDDHVLGSRTAQVKLFVYADPRCPFCKTFFEQTLPRLQHEFGASIAIIYRYYPLHGRGSLNYQEMQAEECAAQIGGDSAFWKYSAALYAVSKGDVTTDAASIPSTIQEIARTTAVAGRAFNACLVADSTVARIERDANDAMAAGIHQTPTIVVENSARDIVVVGNFYERVYAAIKLELQDRN